MSILIRGMEMPRNCGECPFLHPGTAYGKEFPCVCWAKGFPIKPSERDLRDGLCPLVTVPPHGDLIDREKLYEQTANWEAQALDQTLRYRPEEDRDEWRWWSAVLKERSAFKFDVADAPAIIPAEEGE